MIKVYRYDAFASEKDKGNPAGVVLDAERLSHEEMQAIAFRMGYNETTFVVKSESSDLRLRYFTPGKEMTLCGHGTVGAMIALKERGYLEDKETVQVETLAGVLPIEVKEHSEGIFIRMKQAPAVFKPFQGDLKALMEAIGLSLNDLEPTMPVVYGSTGSWTVLVPVKSLEACARMKPQNPLFPEILKEIPTASVHPFTMETIYPECTMHGRHFSSPYSKTIEDPVTGTASGVMGAYYTCFIQKRGYSAISIEQGQEIGKDGRVWVETSVKEPIVEVHITGTGVFAEEFDIAL